MLTTLIAYIVPLLATYRLAYLVANERGPFDVATAFRSWVLRRCDLNAHHWFYAGVTCVKCLSWWLALPCVALVQWGGIAGGALVAWWGVAGGVLVLAQVLDAVNAERKAQNEGPTHTVKTVAVGVSEAHVESVVKRVIERNLNRSRII